MAKTPEFKSIAEEVAFWETHSTADYWDESEEVAVAVDLHKNLLFPNPTVLTERPTSCPRCHQPLENILIEYLTQNEDHLVSVRNVAALQCENQHTYMTEAKFRQLLHLLEQESQQQIQPEDTIHVPVFRFQPV